MPYGGKFLIRRSVRIIPAHKKHRLWAGVLLARRSTPANRNLSAARLSDILPGSYLLAEQSPGSSHCKRLRACCAHRARTCISYRKKPLVSRGFFYFVNKIFMGFLAVLTGIYLVAAKPLPSPIWGRTGEKRRLTAALAALGDFDNFGEMACKAAEALL